MDRRHTDDKNFDGQQSPPLYGAISKAADLPPDHQQHQVIQLSDAEIQNALNNVRVTIQTDSQYQFDKNRFIEEAKQQGIHVIAAIEELQVANFSGSVLVTGNVGKNARVNVKNGGLAVLGDIEYGAMIDIYDKSTGKTANAQMPNLGIVVVGNVGDHVRLNSTSNVLIQNTGNFVQIRAGLSVKAGNIGAGTNIMAKDSIEANNIDDDFRSTHYVNNFIAKNVGKRSVIKAGNIAVGDVGSGSELVSSYNIEAGYIGDNITATARSISILSAGEGCELNAAMGITESISAMNRGL